MNCPICDLPGPTHSTLQHLVVQEDDGTPRCGCDPRHHDGTSPCSRRAGHDFGPCVGFALDEAGKPTTTLVQFSCRADDGEPHPVTVEAILGGR